VALLVLHGHFSPTTQTRTYIYASYYVVPEGYIHYPNNFIKGYAMTVWKNCTVDSLYYNEDPASTKESGFQVKIDDAEIVVSYQDDDGWVEYRGKNKDDGHFQLTCPDRNGEATLHQFPNGNILEGFWVEAGTRGMWRITLA
jgi:hypothetical protein